MSTFLIVTGLVVWGILTLAVPGGLVYWSIEIYGHLLLKWGLILAAIMVFAGSTGGIIATINGNGWLQDPLPADGCYRLTRHTDLIPMSTGKVMTMIPVENATFEPIACPGDGS